MLLQLSDQDLRHFSFKLNSDMQIMAAVRHLHFSTSLGDITTSLRSSLLATASVVQWSQFLDTDPEARVQFLALPEQNVVGLERGPLSLVSTTEELLDRKETAPV
jgi:hypothetical protein